MATVQISFTDNSDNETKFTVYRSAANAASVGSTPAEKLATLEWDATAIEWTYTPEVSDASSTGAFVGTAPTTSPDATGQSFTLSYTEDNAGAYFFGVEAENAIGKSAITSTSAAITIA